MRAHTGFRLPRVCLPRPEIDLKKWAVVACDQYTSEPEYWHEVAREVGDAPSSLNLIFPETYLGSVDAPARIDHIQETMRRYPANGLLYEREGAIYVERTVGNRIRRGLMLELDLEHYDFGSGSTSLIRPTEGTIIARLAPRIEVRSGAELELPHILVLIDDPQHSVIEPIGAGREALKKLYETDLMLGGGRVAGYAVDGAPSVRMPLGFATLVAALTEYRSPPALVVLTGPGAETSAWCAGLAERYLPGLMTLQLTDDTADLPATLAKSVAAHPQAWVCRGSQCLPPIADMETLLKALP